MSQQMQEAPVAMNGAAAFQGPSFWLDRKGAMDTIASVWGIDPNNTDAWWIGAFGDGLAQSVERLSQVVFAPRRGLVGGPALDIDVFPVMPDSPARPVMIGVSDGDGPVVCRGLEDVADCLPDTFGKGPEHVLDCLEHILMVASELIPDFEWRNRPAPTFEDALARSLDRARIAVH